MVDLAFILLKENLAFDQLKENSAFTQSIKNKVMAKVEIMEQLDSFFMDKTSIITNRVFKDINHNFHIVIAKDNIRM